MATDLLIHDRLGERGFITLVMSPAPVANQVDQDILMEPVAVSMRYTHSCESSFRVIGIHMNNGHLESFGQIACEERRATIFRFGCKSELVVQNDMDGSTYPVAAQLSEIQRLSDNALAGESRITMNENRQGAIYAQFWSAGVIAFFLRCSRHAFYNWIDVFQVPGIGG